MNVLQQISNRSSVIAEVFTFLWERKLWWLMPLAILMVLIGVLFLVAQLSSVSPWIYPL